MRLKCGEAHCAAEILIPVRSSERKSIDTSAAGVKPYLTSNACQINSGDYSSAPGAQRIGRAVEHGFRKS